MKALFLLLAVGLGHNVVVGEEVNHLGFKEICANTLSCYNGGSCQDDGNSTYSCGCPEGYIGEQCEELDAETDANGRIINAKKPSSTHYTHTVCEGQKLFMKCPIGYEIEVLDVLFGRNDTATCVHSYDDLFSENERCATPGSLSVIEKTCNGKASCVTEATTAVMDPDRNSDCRSSVAKKLAVSYICKQKIYHALSCEDTGMMMLGCPAGQRIVVMSAFFGRRDSEICSHETADDFEACGASNANETFSHMCDGKEKCVVEASTAHFGDPCPGVNKYMELEYMCSECANVHHSNEDCEIWANQGKCNGSTWMINNCFKACSMCEPGEGSCEDVHHEEDCFRWAGDDEQCSINPQWMFPNCRKSCLKCDRGTACYDDEDVACEYYAGLGEESLCSKNLTFMFEHCRGACFRCSGDERGIHYENKDDDQQCEVWAMVGECSRNPGYMLTQCWKACTGLSGPTHCINVHGDDERCEQWKEEGECVSNPSWMYRNCWKTCTVCEPKQPECKNEWENQAECRYWRYIGECARDRSKAFMLQNCFKECSGCKDVTEVKECKNLYHDGDDETCDYWASIGECTTNYGWMNTYCAKSCSHCSSDWTGGFIGSKHYAGKPLLPGEVFEFSKEKTIMIPTTFYFTGRLTHFTAMFADTNPVTLQIWRYNHTARLYQSRFQYTVTPKSVNTIETIPIPQSQCVNVRQGDRIGFNSRYNAAPIAYREIENPGEDDVWYMRDMSDAFGPFVEMTRAYQFSISAGYEPTEICDNEEKPRITHITDIAWVNIWIGEEDMGNITLGLWGDIAPITVENLVHLMQGTKEEQNGVAGSVFHRVISDFMMQGGDYVWGSGHGRHCSKWGDDFDDEASALAVLHRCGRVSNANFGPNSNGCMWVIDFVAAADWLDGLHVVYGVVLDGMEIARAVEANPTDSEDRPIKAVVMKHTGIKPNPAPHPWWDMDTPVKTCPY